MVTVLVLLLGLGTRGRVLRLAQPLPGTVESRLGVVNAGPRRFEVGEVNLWRDVADELLAHRAWLARVKFRP